MTGGQEGVNVDIIDRLKNHTRGEIDELMSDAIAEIENLRCATKRRPRAVTLPPLGGVTCTVG
jgi:hypothetical protein